MWKVSAGLGVALVVLAGSFKLYYDKTEAERTDGVTIKGNVQTTNYY